MNIKALPQALGSSRLSFGSAGRLHKYLGVEPGAVTFAPCRDLGDDWVLVSESAISDAMRSFVESHRMTIEGSAGVALAAFERRRDRWRGQRVAIVVCGANIDPGLLDRVLERAC